MTEQTNTTQQQEPTQAQQLIAALAATQPHKNKQGVGDIYRSMSSSTVKVFSTVSTVADLAHGNAQEAWKDFLIEASIEDIRRVEELTGIKMTAAEAREFMTLWTGRQG